MVGRVQLGVKGSNPFPASSLSLENSMTFTEIWNQLTRKRPSLLNKEETITLTPENFKALLHQVYEQGQNHEKKV